MADNQKLQVPHPSQQSQEVDLLSHGARCTHATSSRYSIKDLKPSLDAVQRVVCLVLAAWIMLHSNNVLEFLTILAAGQIDPGGAKDILIQALKGMVSEGK